ncbi:MAG: FHA domain-containing protein [Verrucomicrobiales bacterium]|nr:FHA domain-containing protein [Verrucomicrobiales bacterium]
MELEIISKSSTTHFPLHSGGNWKIGRHPDNDIAIDDPKASRYHALLTGEKGAYYIEDLGTGNGTLISGVSVPPDTRVEFKVGDVIGIGEVQIRLSDSTGASKSRSDSISEGETGVLRQISGKSAETVYPLGNDPVLIGRLPICHISIDDPGSSRINAEVVRENSNYFLRDLGSSNGTFLNDSRIKKERLSPGDVVRVGSHRFAFSIENKDSILPAPSADAAGSLPGKALSTPGCSTISFGLIAAIISGLAVFLFMSQSGGPGGESAREGANKSTAGVMGNAAVIVEKPLVADIPVTLQKTGNVRLARQDIIPFPPGQKVAKVYVRNGQRVDKGDKLVSFELTEELRSARKQATAALNQAREDVAKAESDVAKADAVLENAKKNLAIIKGSHDRSLPLYRNGDLLQREWDEILTGLAEAETVVKLRAEEKDQAKRTVVQAEEKVVQVKTDLSDVNVMIDDLLIEAESSGVVNRLELKDGYTVTAINSSMELIEYEKEVKVSVSVSEDDIVFIREDMEVDVWLSRAPDVEFHGSVSYIPPTAANRNYDVEITVPNRDFHFRPGQQVSVRFLTEVKEGAILVPPSSVDSNARGGYHIFTVDSSSGLASIVPVKRGQEVTRGDRRYVEITPTDNEKSVSESDLVIVKGNKAVKDGMRVEIRNPDDPDGMPQ